MKKQTKNLSEIDKMRETVGNLLNKKEYIVGILSIFFSVALAWIIIPRIVGFINPTVDILQIENLFIPSIDSSIRPCPEPVERAIFIISVFSLPILLLLFVFLFNCIFKKVTNLPAIKFIHNVLLIVFLSLIAYLTWIANAKSNFVYFINGIGFGIKTIFSVAVISILINLLILNAGKNHISSSLLKITSFLTNAICWITIFSVVLLHVHGVGLITDIGTLTYTTDFNAAFHPLVQVFLGKQILNTVISQYGLFPLFLEPIWKIIGLNVFKYTLLMSLLMGLSLFLVYGLLKKLIDNKVVGYLGFLSMIWSTFLWYKVFFMYRWPPSFVSLTFMSWPLRILFPIISFFLTYCYFKTADKKLYYISFAIYAISIFWNFDTGCVVYLAWLITLIYEGLCDRDIKKVLFHIMNWVVILLITFGLFTLYIYLRYGHLPIYSEFIWFQKLYYITGFAMLPMPLIHPWNLVIIIYIMGIAISLINLLSGNKSPKVFVIFNLSIVGVGIFSHYQGRSHDFNLPDVCYPAGILITIFADGLIKRIRDYKSVIINFIALNYITFFMIYCSITLAGNYKIIFTTISERAKLSFNGKNTRVTRSAEFIKNSTKKGEEVLLLSNLSGIYCLESRTTNPIKIVPGHLFLKSQVNDILNYLNSDLCQRVFLDMNFIDNKPIWDFIQTNFKVVSISPDRNIGMFIK